MIVTPVTFSLLLIGVHFVQIIHGGHIAMAAANRGAQVASASAGDVAGISATAAAVRTVSQALGAEFVAPPVVDVSRSTVTVTVEVAFDGAVPFLPERVRRSVTVPREQFMKETER